MIHSNLFAVCDKCVLVLSFWFFFVLCAVLFCFILLDFFNLCYLIPSFIFVLCCVCLFVRIPTFAYFIRFCILFFCLFFFWSLFCESKSKNFNFVGTDAVWCVCVCVCQWIIFVIVCFDVAFVFVLFGDLYLVVHVM